MVFQAILLALTIFFNFSITTLLLAHRDRKRTDIIFAVFAALLAAWAFAILAYLFSGPGLAAIYAIKLSYIAASFIGLTFWVFARGFAGLQPARGATLAGLAATIALSFLVLFPQFLTKAIVVHPWGKETVLGVPEYLLFALHFVISFGGGLYVIFRHYLKSEGIARIRARTLFLSVSIPGAFGMFFNLVLPSPWLEDFRYIWIGPSFTLLYVAGTFYGILRHRLFNIKLVAAQVLTLLIWAATLVRMLIADDRTEVLLNGALLVAIMILGTLLLRSVLKEAELVEQLSAANARLVVLDKRKSEFVSLASHQLRSPLTAIKGYASLLLEGSFGRLPDKARGTVARIFESSERLVKVMEDFLTESRIEQNRLEYNFAAVDLKDLARSVLDDLMPLIQRKGLTASFVADPPEADFRVNADSGKLRQVLVNLLDNAVKYTPSGTITVRLSKDPRAKRIRVTIADTGIGISNEALPHLFEKFSRAQGASDTNLTGAGLGLYVAKQIIEAHGGRIWAESEGNGKGTRFCIELQG
jgi:signal transduction histidine kinase